MAARLILSLAVALVTAGPVHVPATQAWTDSGLDVQRGERLEFRTTGRIAFGRGANQRATADGKSDVRSAAYPVASAPAGTLIGKIGSGTPFVIGGHAGSLTMPDTGRLMLGINDNDLGDNSGAFTVSIRPAR